MPRLLIPDNAKTATITNNRYEVVLNRSYQELSEHYGTAIVLARVRRLFTLDEARRAVIEKLEELNRRPFKKRTGCRFSAFEEDEQIFRVLRSDCPDG